MRTDSFTTGSIPKGMLYFVGPFMLSMIVQNLYGAVDLLVVGHFATTADVSAVTIGSQIMGMITQLIIGFATGTTVLCGKYFGAKKHTELTRSIGASVAIFGVFSLLLTLLFLLLANPIISAMQTPAPAVPAAHSYLFVCALGIVFITGFNVISSILMGMGDSKTPFLFVCIACVINIFMDILLVRFLHWGALGAAVATTLAQAGSFLFSLLYLRKNGLGYTVNPKDLKPQKRVAKEVVKIGAPVAVQNALVGISFLFITAIINQMGLVASAAVGVVEKLIAFLIMPAVAFGSAVATVSAQNLGAGQPGRAKQSLRYGILMALIPSVIICIFSQFGGEWMARLFNPNAEVVSAAAGYLQTYVLDCIFVSFVFCMNGLFNSSGYSWFTLLHSLLTTFLGRVPLSFFFSRQPGASLRTIGWAAPISTLASLVLCLLFLRRMRLPGPDEPPKDSPEATPSETYA